MPRLQASLRPRMNMTKGSTTSRLPHQFPESAARHAKQITALGFKDEPFFLAEPKFRPSSWQHRQLRKGERKVASTARPVSPAACKDPGFLGLDFEVSSQVPTQAPGFS